eukprot:403363357
MYEAGLEASNFKLALSSLQDIQKILKQAGQENTYSYQYIQKLQALTQIKGNQFEKASNTFQQIHDQVLVTSNHNENIYAARRNLILSYVYSDIQRAIEEGGKIQLKEEQSHLLADYLQIMGVAHFLNKDYRDAEHLLENSQILAQHSDDSSVLGPYLNNYGMAHYMKLTELNEDLTQELLFEVMNTLKDSLKEQEHVYAMVTNQPRTEEMTVQLNSLVTHNQLMPEMGIECDKFLQSKDLRRVFANMSLILLRNLNKVEFNPIIAYWVMSGLKYTQQHEQKNLVRQLVLLGMFYQKNNKNLMAEGFYNQARDNAKGTQNWDHVHALRSYANHINSMDRRQSEAQKVILQAQEIEKNLKSWHEYMDLLYLPKFSI